MIFSRDSRWLVPLIAAITIALQWLCLLLAANVCRVELGGSQKLYDLLTCSSIVSAVGVITIAWWMVCISERNRKITRTIQNELSHLTGMRHSRANTPLDVALTGVLTQVKESIEREKLIAEYSLDLLCSLDTNYDIVAINPACQRILGKPHFALLGRNISTLIDSGDLQKFKGALTEASSSNNGVAVQTGTHVEGGETKFFEWWIEYSATHGTYFCIARNITDKHRLEQFKKDFNNMIVHDLRTPISSTVMGIDMLLSSKFDSLTERQKSTLTRSRKSLDRLITLISNLLDLDKMEAGRFELRPELVMVKQLFEQAVIAVQDYGQSRGVRIECSGAMDARVAVDVERVVQVLINLLSNAVKYSPDGSTVKLSVEAGQKWVTIMVTDTGSGIPEKFQASIFSRFEQVPGNEKPNSTGLGLYISRAIVESHSGKIGVTSTVGSGSKFWFTLPALRNED